VQLPSKKRDRWTMAATRLAPVLTLVVVAGCASGSSTRSAGQASNDSVVAEDVVAEAERERSPGEIAKVDSDALGFTVTEQLRISGQARTDYDLAIRYLEQDRIEEGIDQLRRVIAQVPDVTAPYIDLGIAYGRLGDDEAAEAVLLDALELTPKHPIAHNELGIVYRRMGRFEEARASYERAIEIHPAFHYARRNLAVLCDLYLQDTACAIEHYQAYLEAVVEDDEVEIWVTDLRARSGL
jgi:Flp pilus assembly protein TadD